MYETREHRISKNTDGENMEYGETNYNFQSDSESEYDWVSFYLGENIQYKTKQLYAVSRTQQA